MKREKRDALSIKRGFIVAPVSCDGRWANGYLFKLSERWPALKSWHEMLCHVRTEELLGTTQSCLVQPGIAALLMFWTDRNRQEPVFDYSVFKRCLDTVALVNSETQGVTKTLYWPYKLGCNLRSHDWKLVQGMIKEAPHNSIVCINE